MGWLVALIILTLLWIFPLGVSGIYSADSPRVSIIIGPFRFLVFPKAKRSKKSGKQKVKKKKSADKSDGGSAAKKETSGGSFKDFLPLVRLVLDLLDDFRRKLRVNRLEMKLTVAGDDPCDLAINYGRAWAAVGNLFPQLERVFVIKKRDVEVACDFTSDETRIFVRVDLTITLGRLLSLGIWRGLRVLKKFIYITKQRKGGANNESKSS